MSFLGKLMGKKDPYDFDDDDSIPGHDPLESERKVNDYLSSTNNRPIFPDSNSEDGLPPEPSMSENSYADSMAQNTSSQNIDPFATQATSNTQQPANDPFANDTTAQMPNGVTGQQMASNYIQKQNSPQKQIPIPTNPQMSKDEVINLKLDSMKNQLDAISQRIMRIEHLLSNNNKKW